MYESAGGGSTAFLGEYGGADGNGLIDPLRFVIRSEHIDVEAVRSAASALATMGTRVHDRTDDVVGAWAPIRAAGVYEAPEGARVHRLMSPAAHTANDYLDAAETASGAISTFADRLENDDIRSRLQSLEEEATEFRDEVKDGVHRCSDELGMIGCTCFVAEAQGREIPTTPWNEDYQSFTRNQDLLTEYAEILADISAGATAAATTIRSIPGMPAAPDPQAYDVNDILAGKNPWGSPPGEPDLDALGQIGWAINGTVDDTMNGLFNLLGFDGEGWSIGTSGETVQGIGNSLLGLTIFLGSPPKARDLEQIRSWLNSDDPLLRWYARRLLDGQSVILPLAGGGRSVDVEDAARRWQERPWQVTTETGLAWLMVIFGPKMSRNAVMTPRHGRWRTASRTRSVWSTPPPAGSSTVGSRSPTPLAAGWASSCIRPTTQVASTWAGPTTTGPDRGNPAASTEVAGTDRTGCGEVAASRT